MITKILLIFLSFSICIRVDGKPLFNSLTFSASERSENQGVNIVIKGPLKEKVLILCQPKNGCSLATPATPVPSSLSNQESRIKEIQTKGKMSKLDPRKPIWLIANLKQGNQIFRKIKESRKNLINEKKESPTPVVSELRRNQTSVKLIKSCHFDKIKKCTNSEWFKFWNSGQADSNSITQSAGSNKTSMTEKESPNQENQAKTTELTKDQMAKSNSIQISSKTEKELMNLHQTKPSELTRHQIHRVKICYFGKFERCTRKEWYKFLKGIQRISKTEKESINLPSKSLSELKKERERKLQIIQSGSELTKDQKATPKICSFKKFEKCTRKEWHEFLKGNGGLTWQLSKSQLI